MITMMIDMIFFILREFPLQKQGMCGLHTCPACIYSPELFLSILGDLSDSLFDFCFGLLAQFLHILRRHLLVLSRILAALAVGRLFDVVDRPLRDIDPGAVCADLDGESVVLDADYFAIDAADGQDVVADLQALSHLADLIVLLLLRTDEHKVHDREKRGDHNDLRYKFRHGYPPNIN